MPSATDELLSAPLKTWMHTIIKIITIKIQIPVKKTLNVLLPFILTLYTNIEIPLFLMWISKMYVRNLDFMNNFLQLPFKIIE